MYGKHLPIRMAKDPEDPVWQWFIFNGPHGERFAWHKELAVAPRDLEYLAQFVDERTEADADFPAKARAVALEALQMDNAEMKRTAIQVLCVVGSDDDMKQVQELLKHPDTDVVKDARCCLFERGIKPRRKA